MTSYDRSNRSTSTKDEQLKLARQASHEDLRRLARAYDWCGDPEPVLGWMMAQKSMDLCSALVVFFNGDPERFNYLPKRDVPQEYRGAARVLDNICLRVNSGFYLVRPAQKLQDRARVKKWLEFQRADRAEGRRGRWILDEKIVEGALKGNSRPMTAQEAPDMDAIRPLTGPGAVQAFVSELMGPKLGERLRKILPRRE